MSRQEQLQQVLYLHLMGQLSQGQLLKQLRRNVLKMNQKAFADWVEVSVRTISSIERDAAPPSQQIINKVFNKLGLKAGLIPVNSQAAKMLFSDRLDTHQFIE